MKKIRLEVTPAQLQCINGALAREEAEDHDNEFIPYNVGVMNRTRQVVWDALSKAGVPS